MATPYLPQHFFFVYPRLSFFVFLPLFFWACQVISALALFFLPTITLKRNLQRYQQWPFREKRGHESDTNSFSPVLGMQGLFEQAERPMRTQRGDLDVTTSTFFPIKDPIAKDLCARDIRKKGLTSVLVFNLTRSGKTEQSVLGDPQCSNPLPFKVLSNKCVCLHHQCIIIIVPVH